MSKKVLTIDDSKTLRMIIGKHLAPFGIQMFQAENGEVGIVRAREVLPDVILLDYNMPVMDGYHTLTELKADPALKAIPVVMLTTETVKETVVKLVKLGLKDYIAKPFTREVLLDKLNPILGLYDSEKGVPEAPGTIVLPSMGSGSDKTPILAIDDKTNILDLLKEYLGEKFHLITADCGKTALHTIAHSKFEFMFLDLTMPDMNAFEILDYYLKSNKNGDHVGRVVAMTLRTAKADIDRALNSGVSLFLYKPFNNEEVAKIITTLAERFKKQEEKTPTSGRYLSANGKVRILDCPPEKSSKFRSVAGALTSDVVREIDEMAEEGLNQLVIKVGEGFLSDLSVTRKFVDMVEHTIRLSMNVRLVADSEQARTALSQFAETASIPTDVSLDFALSSIG
jgi:two-component system, cell cycle response regulator